MYFDFILLSWLCCQGFAFIEFSDDRDAKDAVRDMDGRYILDKKVRVEISRRGRGGAGGRAGGGIPAPRASKVRTEHRVKILGLPGSAHWHSLKEFLREVAEPAFVDTLGRGEGIAEFMSSTEADLVVSKLHDTKYDGVYITVKRDSGSGRERDRDRSRSRDRDRDHRSKERSSRSGRDRSRSGDYADA